MENRTETLITAKVASGQKFEVHEVDAGLRAVAIEYAENYTGSFDYMRSMAIRVQRDYAISSGQVKGILNCLLAERRRSAKPATAPMPVGFHFLADTVYRVKLSQAGRPYAKVLQGGSWSYVGRVDGLTAETVLTVDQAMSYGLASGVCACCGRELSDPKSVEIGIGPICLKRYF